MKTFTPQIYNNSKELIGFDLEVYSIQQKLAQISWLQAIFGVAHVQKRQLSEEESVLMTRSGLRGTARYNITYPQGSKNGIDEDLSFNDTYASRIFFLTKDDINITPKVNPWNWVDNNVDISQPFAIILHANLKSLQINSYEQLKLDVLYALNECPKYQGLTMYEDMSNVWKEFDITPNMNGITRHPYYCLRIDGLLNYVAFGYNGELRFNPINDNIPRVIIGWKVCQIRCNVVVSPNLNNEQVLQNTESVSISGDIIPVEYVLNGDGTVTIPYLNSIYGITLLSRFMINNRYYQGNFFIAGNLNISNFGKFSVGDKITFDASLPLYNS